MIVDRLERAAISSELAGRLRRACAYLREHDFSALPQGRHEIDEDMFFLVQRYETQAEHAVRYEAHRKYVDIQYLLAGHETIHCAELDGILPLMSFDEERDIGFYQDPAEYHAIRLREGELAVFFPGDCHKASFHPAGEQPACVEKVVMKVRCAR